MRYRINYGWSRASLWTDGDPLVRFHLLAGECFGIRKCITNEPFVEGTFSEPMPAWAPAGSAEALEHNGDRIAWWPNGRKSLDEWGDEHPMGPPMPTDLTLPATIPGLVRRGSALLWPFVGGGEYTALRIQTPAELFEIDPDGFYSEPRITVAGEDDQGDAHDFDEGPAFLLDLRSRTSRVHAAWWLDDKKAGSIVMQPGWRAAYLAAKNGETMTDEQVGYLRDLVMAVHSAEGE